MQSIHLICNAHLDPVWLWEWEEGAAEAVNTFRTTADLCECFNGFVFNHNEAVLYRWVEEYEPALFRRIQRLVRQGRWHIMGGWYLQPDCNMPSGESLVRQILLGREFFAKHFGAAPTTAVNLDPFGHSLGLVQILCKSGFDSYLFCRPGQRDCPLPDDAFEWEGYEGSRLLAVRVSSYNSPLGQARKKVEKHVANLKNRRCTVVLWGVGDHGGGPSRKDLRDLAALMKSRPDITIRHSTPETYFSELRRRSGPFPIFRKALNFYDVGCYTSQIRVKQQHRRLEGDLYVAEKMASAAWLNRRMAYPAKEFREAMRDLAFSEFHDILPGSSIQPVEESALRLMHHARESLSRVKARAFFALAGGQPRAKAQCIPILVYNPHPYSVKTIIECEFQLADQNWKGTFTQVEVHQGGCQLPSQIEKEVSNLNLDWRKRVVFATELAPFQMNRFDCETSVISAKPAVRLKAERGAVRFRTKDIDVVINTRTGLLDRYAIRGIPLVLPGACRPLVMLDNADPWGMTVCHFRRRAGAFTLLDQKTGARFSGVQWPLPSVRIIEDGPVRTVVEAVLGYGDSFICQRYKLPKRGTEIEVECRVYWNEKDRMLKLSIPTPDRDSACRGQTVFGVEPLASDGNEKVVQQWVAVVTADGRSLLRRSSGYDLPSPAEAGYAKAGGRTALTCINDGIYGADFLKGELRLSMLRSPAYSGHPIGQRPILPQDRFSPRIDQGERVFRFWLNGGSAHARLAAVSREAQAKHEPPMTLSFFPSGKGNLARSPVLLSDPVIQLVAAKKAERRNALILRLFESTGRRRSTTVSLPFANMKKWITLRGFEIRTLRVDPERRIWTETDLMEQPVS